MCLATKVYRQYIISIAIYDNTSHIQTPNIVVLLRLPLLGNSYFNNKKSYKAYLNTQSISVFLLNRLMCTIHIGHCKSVWGKLGQKGLNWGKVAPKFFIAPRGRECDADPKNVKISPWTWLPRPGLELGLGLGLGPLNSPKRGQFLLNLSQNGTLFLISGLFGKMLGHLELFTGHIESFLGHCKQVPKYIGGPNEIGVS